MLHGELSKLVNRLRSITGQRVTDAQQAEITKTVDDSVLQLLEQSLRRHPCIDHFSKTSEEAKNSFFDQLKESITTSSSSTGLQELFEWINTTSDELELERLYLVFEKPEEVVKDCSLNYLEKLGYDAKPKYSQNSLSYACPWNVWLNLLSGPLVNFNFSKYERGDMKVTNSTPNIRKCISIIQNDIHDAVAWTSLLHEIDGFPLAAVRSVWLAALYFFPSCAGLAMWYIRKEIADSKNFSPLSKCLSEDDAKKSFKSSFRILNVFYRHLPLCLDCRLYEIFFDFVQENIQPDKSAILELYRICLQRDVGEQLGSTNIWNGYINCKTGSSNEYGRRNEWKKKILRRMLQTPLRDLDKVKEAYDQFLSTDYRIAPEEKAESEKSYNRSRSAAQELSKLFSATRLRDHVSALFLPRPIKLEKLEGTQNEIEIWGGWHQIIEYVRRPALSSGSARDTERLIKFLFMRASLFPYQVDSWSDIAFLCTSNSYALEPHKKSAIIKRVLELSSLFLYNELAIQLLQVNFVYASTSRSEDCFARFKDALLYHSEEVVHYIRDGITDREAPALHLESICVLAVAWMKLPQKESNPFHIRLVSRFVLHTVDFLSLSIKLLRKFTTSEIHIEPTKIFLPFHTFCHNWIELELVRNKAVEESFLILKQWKEFISRLVNSTRKRNYSAEACGADELFIRSCVTLVQACPSKVRDVTEMVLNLVDQIQSTNTMQNVFFHLCDQMLYDFYSSPAFDDIEYSYLDAGHRRLLCSRSAPQRVDSEVFGGRMPFLSSTLFYLQDLSEGSIKEPEQMEITYPEEGLWSRTQPEVAPPRLYNRKRNREENAPLEKRARPDIQSNRAVLNLWKEDFTLASLLQLPSDTVPVHQLERLIKALPFEYQYFDASPIDDQQVSVSWLLSLLEKTEGL